MVSLFYPAASFTLLKNMKIWCNIQVIIYIHSFVVSRWKLEDILSKILIFFSPKVPLISLMDNSFSWEEILGRRFLCFFGGWRSTVCRSTSRNPPKCCFLLVDLFVVVGWAAEADRVLSEAGRDIVWEIIIVGQFFENMR